MDASGSPDISEKSYTPIYADLYHLMRFEEYESMKYSIMDVL